MTSRLLFRRSCSGQCLHELAPYKTMYAVLPNRSWSKCFEARILPATAARREAGHGQGLTMMHDVTQACWTWSARWRGSVPQAPVQPQGMLLTSCCMRSARPHIRCTLRITLHHPNHIMMPSASGASQVAVCTFTARLQACTWN